MRCIFSTRKKEKEKQEAMIADIENGICEESMATEERLADIENALCELSDAIFSE
jgi:hypothetical protein